MNFFKRTQKIHGPLFYYQIMLLVLTLSHYMSQSSIFIANLLADKYIALLVVQYWWVHA